MNFEVKPVEKGFLLIYRGVEIGTSKLQCDAVLVGRQLDTIFNHTLPNSAELSENDDCR